MDWVLRSPQIHSTFGSLGHAYADGYHVDENCNAALENILQSILTEDEYLRPYRRSIAFAKHIEKYLVPLLVHAKEDKTLELLIRILANLTTPIELLVSLSDANGQTIYDINNLLASTKAALTDIKATTALVDFIKKNQKSGEGGRLSAEQCANINNSLLLLRNVLHIPEEPYSGSSDPSTPHYSMQNQIMWNIFSQGIDAALIELMIIPEASNWAVTMVQVVALLYKDQHVATLHQLLNSWLEMAGSESTEDNESNTSKPQVSENSSFMLTSDPNSDSLDSGKDDGSDGTCAQNKDVSNNVKELKTEKSNEKKTSSDKRDAVKTDSVNETSISYNKRKPDGEGGNHSEVKRKAVSQTSDVGYGTQIKTIESVSTSSNDDEYPMAKPVNLKPVNPKQKPNNNWPVVDKKPNILAQRLKSKIYSITAQEIQQKAPSDLNISIILKEFTVDFLLKGYNSLVENLYNRIISNTTLDIDTSHFYWLVTYFLKFAAQIQLDFEHISSVLSFEIVSYLVAEGVNLCEQSELAIKLEQDGFKSIQRRLHLVVTAIREFIQTIQAYMRFPHTCNKTKDFIANLAKTMSKTEELRNLIILLLQYYDKKYYTKQYLLDLIVTNHLLLEFLDSVTKTSDDKKDAKLMVAHIKQFGTPEIMQQYGTLLEGYQDNAEFVNDCVFTIMHHVGTGSGAVVSLFQPHILTAFTSICNTKFLICDDWSDLIRYVINAFIKMPQTPQSTNNIRLESQCLDKPETVTMEAKGAAGDIKEKHSDQGKWTEEEISSLSWNYMQYKRSPDVIKQIYDQLKENGISKSRMAIIKELYRQNLITQELYKYLTREENENKKVYNTEQMRDDEIHQLCKLLRQDGKSKSLDWLRNVLLEICFAKICFEKKKESLPSTKPAVLGYKLDQRSSKLFKENINNLPIMSSVAWLAILHKQPVALVPWNCEQSAICKDFTFLQLMHKFGFTMPVDSEKVFIRIPIIWTTGLLYKMAGKLSHVDTSKLKFSLCDLSGSADFPSEILHDSHNIMPTPLLQNYATSARSSPQASISFNTGHAAPANWLDIIKRSQNRPLIDLGRVAMPSDVGMGLSASCSVRPGGSRCAPVRGLSIDADDDTDTNCSNSIFDTASVTSHLTRMNVSDVDEKPEEMYDWAPPCARVRGDALKQSIAEVTSVSAHKRPHDMQSATPSGGKKIRTNSH